MPPLQLHPVSLLGQAESETMAASLLASGEAALISRVSSAVQYWVCKPVQAKCAVSALRASACAIQCLNRIFWHCTCSISAVRRHSRLQWALPSPAQQPPLTPQADRSSPRLVGPLKVRTQATRTIPLMHSSQMPVVREALRQRTTPHYLGIDAPPVFTLTSLALPYVN